MAAPSNKAATKTKLIWGVVEVEVALFTTKASPSSLADFDTAGPNGGKLRYEQRAVEKAVDEQVADEPVRSDPLAEEPPAVADPGLAYAEAIVDDPEPMSFAGSVEGEYRQVLVEDGTGEEVSPEKVRRGVRREDGSFVDVTEQIAAIEARTKLDAMAIKSFMDIGQVQRERIVGSYFLAPDDSDGQRPLRLLYEALRKRRRAAIVKLTKRSRQSLALITAHPKTKTLILHEMIWAEDFREPAKKALAIQQAVVTESEVEAACGLLDAMADTRGALDEERDDALRLREELRTRAEEGEMDVQVVEPIEEKVSVAVDLEEQLAASLAAVSAA